MLAKPWRWSSPWIVTRWAKSCSVDSATKDVGDIWRLILELLMRRSLRKIRPAISRNAWYCFVNKLVSAGEGDWPLLAPTELPFDVPRPLEAYESRGASNDLVFADELFFTNKFQNWDGVSELGTETNPPWTSERVFEIDLYQEIFYFFFWNSEIMDWLAIQFWLITHDEITKADPVERIGFRFKA